jgi:hypothetical protein
MAQATYHQVSSLPCFVVFTDGNDVDIVLHSKAAAQKHKKELVKMGCEGVKIKEYVNEEAFWKTQEV